MINNDKRREVAKRLRELEIAEFDDGDFFDCGEVDEVLGLITDDGAWYEAKGVWRLAELIDRTVCHDVSNDFGKFTCSNCGCSLDTNDCDYEPTMWVDGKGMVPSYCPNCGKEIRYNWQRVPQVDSKGVSNGI